jgi:triosephosphate isomerase
MLIINFKTYHESTGAEALKLAKVIDEASKDAPTDVCIAVQLLDVEKIASQMKNVKVLAQHIDGHGYGAHTGHVLPEEVKLRGAQGTLLNHSEKPYPEDQLGKAVDLAHVHFPDTTIVCTPSFEKTAELERRFDLNKIAFEPPELIGGDISVSSAQPEIIKKVVDISPDKQILVGAGVKTVDDIKISLDLGAIGVLVASGVVKAEDPAAVVTSFLSAWK